MKTDTVFRIEINKLSVLRCDFFSAGKLLFGMLGKVPLCLSVLCVLHKNVLYYRALNFRPLAAVED